MLNSTILVPGATMADYQLLKRWVSSAVHLVILLSRAAKADATPQPLPKKAGSDGWKLIWADDFSNLNTKMWQFDEGNGEKFNLPGWGNNELEYYTKDSGNVRIENGKLVIQADEQTYKGFGWTSGKVTTRGTKAFNPGMRVGKTTYKTIKIEIKVKLPNGNGLWPAIWMLPAGGRCYACGDYGPWPESGEIDILEAINGMKFANGVVHYGRAGAGSSQSARYPRPKSLSDGKFHAFSIEWSAHTIRWYLDGVNYHTAFSKGVNEKGWYTANSYGAKAASSAPFDKPFYLIMNLAVGGNWAGAPDSTTKFPAQMVVDHVRVWGSTLDGA